MREKILRNLFEKINQSNDPDNYKELINILCLLILMKVIKYIFFIFLFEQKSFFFI